MAFFRRRAARRRANGGESEKRPLCGIIPDNMDFKGIAEKYLIYGPPDRCIEQFEAFKGAGARHFILRPAGALETDMDQMSRLAEEIIPKVRN